MNRVSPKIIFFQDVSYYQKDFWDALYLLFKEICFILLLFVDDEKNKMLPEAESINKDGSQDGLMEAANIPLQSKEEDQM